MLIKFKERIMRYRVGHILTPFIIGGLSSYLLNRFYNLDLVEIFGRSDSYVYYYVFSTIVQGFVALVAFLGALAVFKWQRDQSARDKMDRGLQNDQIDKLDKAMRELTIDLKTCAVVCLFDVALALIGIVFIPYFNSHLMGPIYLAGNVALSIWVLFLSRPIVEKVLRLTP